MADLTATLLGCQNPDATIRGQAEQALAQAEQSNYPEFALALATELATEGKDLTVRQLAGIHFKNLFVAKEAALQVQKHQKWQALDATQRSQIKATVIQTLVSAETVARHTAAQACAEIAAVELPYAEWAEFLPTLTQNVSSAEFADSIKISCLECLGFTCERISSIENIPEIATQITDGMLTTIVDGMRKERPDPIRLAATTALRNSLNFTRKNMETVAERNQIMQNICEATQSTSMDVRAAAYECIAQIAFLYYDKLKEYMEVLFNISLKTIETDEETVAIQAIEFWSTLCEEEIELIIEEDYGKTGPYSKECVRYVLAAVGRLVPLLTQTLTKQDEHADETEWNLSMAAATCLQLVAQTVEDPIVDVVAPFVQQHIQSENWRYREAATMAFSSILDGPSSEKIGPYVNQSIPLLLTALSDPNVLVKDTTAWTIGRICELHVRSIPAETFPTLVNGLSEKLLSESASVSSQSCFAIHNLAAAFADDDAAANTGTNALSKFMPTLLDRLMQVIDREDADESNLRVAAFEAVSVLVQNSAPDCLNLLKTLLPVIINRLQASFAIPALTNEDRERKEGIQGLLCCLLQVIVLKLQKEDVIPHADNIMTNLLQVLQLRNATCHEEAFSAISAVCDSLEADFEKYIQALAQFLVMGLKNFQNYHVCAIAVGLVGDVARNIESKILPYCNEIMTALVESLQNQYLHRSVKPPVLSCFGDIAMAIGGSFDHYLQVSIMMLMQASQTTAPDHDEELIEYVNQLREGILEAYAGIIQGLQDGNQADIILPYIQSIMMFLETLANDTTRDFEVIGKAAGLLGDIASALGRNVKDSLQKPYVGTLIELAYSSGDERTQETCTWAKGQIQSVLAM